MMLTFLFLRESSDVPWAAFPLLVYATFFLFMIDAGMLIGAMHLGSLFLHSLLPTWEHASMASAQWPGTFGVTDPAWK